MADRKILILLLATISLTYAEVQLITKPEPGQEYVFLQTSGAGSRPVERKEKPSANERVFETAHKLPPSVTYALNQAEAEDELELKPPAKIIAKPKREALPADAAAPAPAGAIKLDVQQLLAKYKTELRTSTTTTTTAKPSGTTRSSSGRNTRRPRPLLGNKRTKKEAQINESVVPTTVASVLTTSSAGLKPIERDDDIPLIASGSEKQRSRIQIKKGPNGQEYEYEYVYYYYDDDDATDTKKDAKTSGKEDGSARNEITPQQASVPSRSRGGSPVTPEPAVNEVLPTSRGRSRSRQLEEEDVADERLPANTRFPPRSRNLNTTPSNADEQVEEVKPTRSRSRGRPETPQAKEESDSVSDETQGSRGRTRANVRRPSSLVDSASFNTHTSIGEQPPNGSGPSFPSDLPAGPVRFLGATPNERMDLTSDKKESASLEEGSTDAAKEEPTTVMSAMDKVALDLYAILQGTQRLSGEQDAEGNTELNTEINAETTTFEATTEIPTTEITTPSTTTTTTTTTTSAPSTSAPETGFGRNKFRARPALGGRKPIGSHQSTTTSTETPSQSQDGKPKNRFSRPSFGSRPRARTTPAPSDNVEGEQKEQKEETKPVSSGPRTRSRFGAARTKATTTAPEGASESSSAAPNRPSLRPRPTFNLRGRTRPTPQEADSAPTEDGQEASTTVRSRPRINASNVRPLRPGPRINLTGGRGRLGATTPAAESPVEAAPVAEEDQEKTNVEEASNSEKEQEVTPAPDASPISRLRNRQRSPLQVRPAAPKAAASAPVQVRRVNPLLSRRKPVGEASTTEAALEVPATDAPADFEEGATDAVLSSTTTTTEEPKGLNKLLAGRRRLTLRQPGTIA